MVWVGINDFLVGGAQRLIADYLNNVNSGRYDYALVVLRDFPDRRTLDQFLPPTIPVYRLGFKGFYDFPAWLRLIKLVWDCRPDVVISHLFFSNTVFRVLQLAGRYKTICVEHNTYTNKPILHQLVDRLLAPLSSGLVAVSKTVADYTSQQEKIPRHYFTVIRNGVPLSKIRSTVSLISRSEARSRRGIETDDLVLLNVGRLTRQKNQELLINSFAQWSARPSNARLYIVGEGALKEQLMNLCPELVSGGRVVFTGVQENIFEWYVLADALVSTSDIEGLSIAYLEALAVGVPIVATLTAGTDELLRDRENGVIIARSQPEAVIDAWNTFLKLDRARLAVGARQTAQNFDIERTVSEYENLIDRILAHG